MDDIAVDITLILFENQATKLKAERTACVDGSIEVILLIATKSIL
jgi:hypothetical protein